MFCTCPWVNKNNLNLLLKHVALLSKIKNPGNDFQPPLLDNVVLHEELVLDK